MNGNPQQQRGIRITLTVIVAVVALLLGLLLNRVLSPQQLSPAELSERGAVVLENPRIIAPFVLVDHTGAPFELSRLEDKWTLLFFGFTTCPDICPATLSMLSNWYESLEADLAQKTQIVLVTVDPARDTPEELQSYVQHFHQQTVGVTGEFLQIKRLADNLNAAFNKVTLNDGDYTVDHSSFVALINPYGHYHGFFRSPVDAEGLGTTFPSIVASFNH